ncbi:MAG: hypothetical protein ACRDJU_00570 [Actinomycetota bacterium]
MLTADPTGAELVAALRTAFRAAAAGLGPDPALAPGQPSRRRSRHPHPLPLGAMALGLAVLLSALVVLWPGAGQQSIKTGDGPVPVPAVTGPPLPVPVANTWQLLPTATDTSRTGVSAVWTGSEMLVMGGSGSKPSYASGISFDPAHSRLGLDPRLPSGCDRWGPGCLDRRRDDRAGRSDDRPHAGARGGNGGRRLQPEHPDLATHRPFPLGTPGRGGLDRFPLAGVGLVRRGQRLPRLPCRQL